MNLMELHHGKGVRMSDIAAQAGVSRQALYLHFKSRTELLVATVQYGDEVKQIAKRRRSWDEAATGVERLNAYIEFWGNYIPDIYGLARSLMAVLDNDEAAAAAWADRMEDMRSGCLHSIEMMAQDGTLSPHLTVEDGTNLLYTLLSVRNWELLTVELGWTQKKYIKHMKMVALQVFVSR